MSIESERAICDAATPGRLAFPKETVDDLYWLSKADVEFYDHARTNYPLALDVIKSRDRYDAALEAYKQTQEDWKAVPESEITELKDARKAYKAARAAFEEATK